MIGASRMSREEWATPDITNIPQTELFYRVGVALVIGILVGLQREYARAGDGTEEFAGVRTFALFGLAGAASGLLALYLATPWITVVTLLVVGAVISIGYVMTARSGSVGLTTEVAVIVTVLSGVLSVVGQLVLAAAIGVAMTVLLSLKLELHAFAQRLTKTDIYAALKLGVMTAIVLPLLPTTAIAPPPLDVLVPARLWQMVIFISAISLLGYVLLQLVGTQRGIGLTGLLGGLVSSTAVTLSLTQRSRQEPELSPAYTLGITVAWTTMFARVLVILALINLPLFQAAWPPLVAAALVGLVAAAIQLSLRPADKDGPLTLTNPFELGPAVMFALVYGLILVLAKLAQQWFGILGVYLASALAGLTDVDAITLSMAELSGVDGTLDLATAARAVGLATLVNTLVKGSMVLAGGAPALRRSMIPILATMVVVGGALVIFWPV